MIPKVPVTTRRETTMRQAGKLSCIALVLALALSNTAAEARVSKFVVESQTLLNGGASYGQVGTYQRLRGYALGELDPLNPGNAGIVNLGNAPRNGAGMVEYRVDVEIHTPTDSMKTNGASIYEVVNRGNMLIPGFINTPTAILLEQGFTLIWSGWQGDIPRVGQNLIGSFPIATDAGQPIVAPSREEFVDRGTNQWVGTLSYPAATLDESQATLTLRQRERDPRQPISSWEYVNERQIRVTPPGAPFDSGAIFEFIYPAKDPIVAGIGFAATRDVNAFLRYESSNAEGNPNPLAQLSLNRHLSMGVSQSGRFLRDFLYQGFNADEQGRKVFDGAMPIIPGSRKTWVNFAFAQPGRWSKQHEEHLQPGDQFPFAYPTTTDPVSGRTDGVLDKCGASNTCPKVMQVDGEFEVWGARGSLLVSDGDPRGPRPLVMPDNVRLYMVAGTPHGGSNLITPSNLNPGICKNVNTPLGSVAVNRALILSLDNWVATGASPPKSRYGFVSPGYSKANPPGKGLPQGDLVSPDQTSTGFPVIPNSNYSGLVNYLQLTDYSVAPPLQGAEYSILVPRVDDDGNSRAGVRLPAVEAPIATYTAWNVRSAGNAEGENCLSRGSYLPFAKTRAERLVAGDPRPSIEERYRDREHYLGQFSRAAAALVRDGFLLPEDANAMIQEAGALDLGLPAKR